MDSYLSPLQEPKSRPKLVRPWKRSLLEINGRFPSTYKHECSALLLRSYSEMGVFCHSVTNDEGSCPTLMSQLQWSEYENPQLPFQRMGVSGLEFDNQGIYLASATSSGCLTVYDFESLYCHCKNTCQKEIKPVVHLPLCRQIDVVRWNICNQDEIACSSMKSSELYLYDIGYCTNKPTEILKAMPASTQGYLVSSGLSDVSFVREENSRVFASSLSGLVYAWDRRISSRPMLELTSNSGSSLNSIELNIDNWLVFGASASGFVYAWDLRGGKSSTAFQSHKKVYNPPLIASKLSLLLEDIPTLKAQSEIASWQIHSINLDPSCQYQLAFHLDNGWSGVLNTHSLEVSHVHCPPPSWLDTDGTSSFFSCLRKPSWLPTCSIYAVGSSARDGIYLLDFFPDKSSVCHVDFDHDGSTDGDKNRAISNMFIPLSDSVTACTAHPLNGTLVAGTKGSSLLVVSQAHQSLDDVKVCEPNS